jgi:hypothetical protein
MSLGPAWVRNNDLEHVAGSAAGGRRKSKELSISLAPEGPQRSDLAVDLAAALDAEPEAGKFFDSLAQFYRKGYLRWVDATKRSPEVRAERIAELVELLKAGHKQRPEPRRRRRRALGDAE